MDPRTLRRVDMRAEQYFQYETEFTILSERIYGRKFQVLDCDIIGE